MYLFNDLNDLEITQSQETYVLLFNYLFITVSINTLIKQYSGKADCYYKDTRQYVYLEMLIVISHEWCYIVHP